MDRLARLREHLDIGGGRGLEIGPLLRPTVTPDLGEIYYADHASTAELQSKYGTDPDVDVNSITPVDFVLGEHELSDATAGTAPFDYVIASHVIEHVPNIIGWLEEIAGVLKPRGRLSLCIPDRRYTFDIRRRKSDLSEAMEAYLLKLRRPAVRATFDHFYRHLDPDLAALWNGDLGYSKTVPMNLDAAMELSNLAVSTDMYVDTHCWVVTDEEFLELLDEVASIGLLNFKIISITQTQPGDHEFFATLERLDPDLDDDERTRIVRSSIAARKDEIVDLQKANRERDRSTNTPAEPMLHSVLVSRREDQLLNAKRRVMRTLRATAGRIRSNRP